MPPGHERAEPMLAVAGASSIRAARRDRGRAATRGGADPHHDLDPPHLRRRRGDQRATDALSALGSQRYLFCAALVGQLAVVGAVLGVVQVLLRWALTGRVPAGVVWDLASVGGLAFLWLLRQAAAVPSLVLPSLPRSEALGTLAASLGPRPFDAALATLLVAGLLAAAYRTAHGRRGLALVAVAGLAPPDPVPLPAGNAANVLILAADSVRPDHLSALGYGRATTPNVDRLVGQGTLFDHALAPLARTTPSWLSVLTGRYPHHHGIRHMFPPRALRAQSLPTLFRRAREAGYRTAVSSDYAGDFFSTFGLDIDQRVLPPPLTIRTVFEREIVTRSPLALAWLSPLPERLRPSVFRYLMTGASAARIADEVEAALAGPRPFFVTAFFSTTHVPFAAPWPYYQRFTSATYRGDHRFAYQASALADLTRANVPLAARDASQVVALYDGALAAVDDAVGRIVAALDARGLDRNTLVVFLSDHGENLFEPGQTTLHGKWFRGGDEANRVPLVLRGPGVPAGRRVSGVVSLTDLAPTLCDLLGWPSLPGADGRSLRPAIVGKSVPDGPVFAETGLWLDGGVDASGIHYPGLLELLEADPDDGGQLVLKAAYEDEVIRAKHRAVWHGSHKLIYEPTAQGYRLRLFDLARDPRQEHDLGPGHPRAAELSSWLWSWLALDPERELDSRRHLVRRHDG